MPGAEVQGEGGGPAVPARPLLGVVLAAGRGTRMRSELPKVLHRAAGQPLLAWVVAAAREAGCGAVSVIVGYGAERVQEEFAGEGLGWVLQAEQRGTGHAVAQIRDRVAEPSLLVVLSGDVPLIRGESLRRLVTAAASGWGAMATAELAEPGSLGRVMARADGTLERIVEVADAGPAELAVRRINAGFYALPAPEIFPYLDGLVADNAQGELYLTDALTAAAAAGRRIALVELEDPAEGLGVNSRRELAEVHWRLIERAVDRLLDAGVTILDPARTVIEPGVRVGPDTVIHPGVSLLGHTAVGSGCTLHPGAWLRDCRLGDGVVVEPYCVLDGAEVAAGCRVGPFARLRPASVLLPGARVGNFVEVKNAQLGEGAKAGHLTYLGDATVGAGSNLGAGVVTCNYDGERKHRTEIGRGAFIGSDTMLVAPVSVGDGATTAAGSVITKDVPPGGLGVGRARQRNLPDWSERKRKGKAPAGGGEPSE